MGFLQRLFSRAPKPRVAAESAPQVLATAEEYRRSGQLAEAIDTLERGAITSPGYVGVHVSLGRVYQQADRLDDALRAYQSALALDRQNLVAIRQLADVYLRQGHKIDAIKKLKLYRGLQPGDRDVNELIERLDLELNPRPAPLPAEPAPVAETARELTTSPINPPLAPQPDKPPDTAPIVPPPSAASLIAALAEHRAASGDADPDSEPSGRSEGPTMAMTMLELLGPLQQLERERAQQAAEAQTPGQTQPEGSTGEPPNHAAPLESGSEVGTPPGSPSAAPAVTETLADLYRDQGYLADAREGYRSLADAEDDPSRRQELASKAETVRAARLTTPEARLRAWLSRFPPRAAPGIGDMGEVLRKLVADTEGVHAVALTDFEGLPVVAAGPGSDSPEMEVLVAELTAFWKGVRRIDDEIGSGSLGALCLQATGGAAVVSAVSDDYALILHLAAGAPVGRIRYEAARTAWLLKPALG